MLEILAPVGGAESLTAALNAGADAVYLGASAFSARKNAENFDDNALYEAVKLCHTSGVKVNLAVNTLVYDDEFSELEKTIRLAAECKVDAIIVQDLGVLATIKRISPNMLLHASTQMTITSAEGAKAAKKLGFSRVVLARELSFKEIAEIVKNVDIETEVFVHGALCVSVSGQCYMSAMLGGRSGNRGLCAQPCRLNFTAANRESVISLKDLSIIDRLSELEEIGVTSAKIEGRMKRPEYVAAAVSACRDSLAGKAPDMATLKAVFSRSGFTTGYFDNDYRNMQGVRTKDDVLSAEKALSSLKSLYAKPYKRYGIKILADIKANSPSHCMIKYGELTAEEYGDIPEKALNKPLDSDSVCARLTKLGGTVYECEEAKADVEDGLMLTAAQLNELRRKTIDKMTNLIFTANTPNR